MSKKHALFNFQNKKKINNNFINKNLAWIFKEKDVETLPHKILKKTS